MSDWNDVIALNQTAVFAVSQMFARHVIAARAPGRIINIASLMTFAARRTTAAYDQAKAVNAVMGGGIDDVIENAKKFQG